MATDLREKQQVSQREPIPGGRRSAVWPIVLTVIAVLVLGGAAALFLSEDATAPFESDLSYSTGAFTEVREGGPYVEIVAPGIRPWDAGMIAAAEQRSQGMNGPASSVGDAMTQIREGGSYVGTGEVTTEEREG